MLCKMNCRQQEGKQTIVTNIQANLMAYIVALVVKSISKGLNPKYKTLFVNKYTFICKVFYKQ